MLHPFCVYTYALNKCHFVPYVNYIAIVLALFICTEAAKLDPFRSSFGLRFCLVLLFTVMFSFGYLFICYTDLLVF